MDIETEAKKGKIGTVFKVFLIEVRKDTSEDFLYLDEVYIGKNPTSVEEGTVQGRKIHVFSSIKEAGRRLLYTGKYSHRFIFAPFNLVVCRQIYDWANSYVSNYLSLNTTTSGRIQDGAKSFVSEEGRKITGENNPVYSSRFKIY